MNAAFMGLIRKEWLISRLSFMLITLGLLSVWLISLGFTIYHGQPGIGLVVTTMILGGHIFYIAIFLLSGLIMEGKTQLWLHSPQSAYKILLGKIVTGVYMHLASFSIFILATIVLFEAFPTLEDFNYLSLFVSGGFGITAIGIELGLYLLFYWAFYHATGTHPVLGKYKALITLSFAFLLHSLLAYLGDTSVVNFISGLWPLPFENIVGLYFEIANGGGTINPDSIPLTIGYLLLYLFRISIWFLISVWLLEKVVEVK
ncbi:hypothetical protein JOC95_003376 [Bacillus tianshenii]|uniref:Uncharacterized protein n=2 Tax=Sutcliffiella tianshenii TaxID=1463404 RepID=A0ABS2P3D7_9BACI|nr:hypothetical protein [Bacillus tianshenii]